MADHNSIIPGENWKPIPDYPGYEVSDHGRVRSYWKRYSYRPVITAIAAYPIRTLKQNLSGKRREYWQVSLCKNGTRHPKNVHCLVLEAFICPRQDGFECCHIDNNPQNNHLSNLRWGTKISNNKDKIVNGTYQYGENNCMAKLTWEKVKTIRKLFNDGMRQCDIVRLLGLTTIMVFKVVRNKSWVIHS